MTPKKWKNWPQKSLIIGPGPFFPQSSPGHSPTAQNWFSISWNLGTRHLFSYLWDRGILSHISNINFQFWAVLGSWGQQRNKNSNPHRYVTFEGSFLCFHGQKNYFYFIFFLNIVASALKSYICSIKLRNLLKNPKKIIKN